MKVGGLQQPKKKNGRGLWDKSTKGEVAGIGTTRLILIDLIIHKDPSNISQAQKGMIPVLLCSKG